MKQQNPAKRLRHGYTTGACAAAAAAGAARMLVRQCPVDSVSIPLPAGFDAMFALHGQRFTAHTAACYVIKDAGDDPDVTDGAEIHCEVSWSSAAASAEVTLLAGTGVGQVTKPGLAVAPGQPAVNPVPRQMIDAAVRQELSHDTSARPVRVVLSIPDGVARAGRTLNARLGIVGGLSILGTTGVVTPVSHQAWRDTIAAAVDVAVACGCRTIVLSGGRTSEKAAFKALPLAEEAFVLMGDHVGFALRACLSRQVPRVIVAAQFAKLVKIAAGHADTHAQAARLDLAALAAWAEADGLDESTSKQIELAHTAREAFLTSGRRQALAKCVASRTLRQLRKVAAAIDPGVVLVDYAGEVFAAYGAATFQEDTSR